MKISILGLVFGLGISAQAFAGATYGFRATQVLTGPGGEATKVSCICTLHYGSFSSCQEAIKVCERIFPSSAVSGNESLSEVAEELVVKE
jgi:hypothetical protein